MNIDFFYLFYNILRYLNLMTTSEISILRLQNQQITHRKFTNIADSLSWLGAIQGQDYAGAKWSLGVRTNRATDSDVEKAFATKSILRTWLMRGTLHFVCTTDIRWMLALLSPRIIANNKRRYLELELDDITLRKSSDLLSKALTETPVLNKTQLLLMLQQNKISTQGQRAAYILQRASLEGHIAQIHSHRTQPNYILLDTTTHSPLHNRLQMLAMLASRYFTSRGPATLHDFIWWSGLTTSDARTALNTIKHQLIQETIDNQTYYLPFTTHYNPTPTPILLPGFDEFLLGYKNREASIAKHHQRLWCPGNNGMFMPFIVSSGQVCGTWKRTIKKDNILIQQTYFDTMPKVDILEAAKQYSLFMEKNLVLQSVIN